MLYACVQRFDVTGNLEKFCKILGTKQALRWLKLQKEATTMAEGTKLLVPVLALTSDSLLPLTRVVVIVD